MPYEVLLADEAERFLKKCDRPIRERIIDKLEDLGKNPRLGKPLTANLAGLWSLRMGDHRAIYQIKDSELLVMVIRLGHRKNVYD
ncbi:MAG: type II toxin-antitoxin system RelE/ParE family toxin [Nanoarchaeota archaeon]|nr:type II toxin-antitoxin system RelE/ParE family toxin [Nanoarchaeota archaeon]